MYVISASRKTDIPAFYSEWFMNRIRAGFCHWVHPYTGQVYTLSLDPQDCIAIVFWTRNPEPLLPYLNELADRGFRYYFMVTIMGYPFPLETDTPELSQATRAFQALSQRVTPDFVFWKYDPIIVSNITPIQYHVDRFGEIAECLADYTHCCIYSWLIMFDHIQKNLAELVPNSRIVLQSPSKRIRHNLLSEMLKIAHANDLRLGSCFSEDHLHVPGIQPASCVDIQVLRQLTAEPEMDLVPASQLGQALRGVSPIYRLRALAARLAGAVRGEQRYGPCRCRASIDIGHNDTCLFGCAYCLATVSRQKALRNHQAHDPEDSLLCRPASLRFKNLGKLALPFSFESKLGASR